MSITTLPNGCTVELKVGDATKIDAPDNAFDLVVGSPPYCDARTYGIGAQRNCSEWIDFMLAATREACRVSSGLVVWVCAGVTRDWNYWPACEGLLYEWWRAGGQCWRPAYWHRVGIPGSGGRQWLRADVEYCLAFKRDHGPLAWADNTASGHAPKYPPGGAPSYRMRDGVRVNRSVGNPRANGEVRALPYTPPAKANPGTRIVIDESNLQDDALIPGMISIPVGGSRQGDEECHDNEAPFPEKLASFFIRSWCKPGGTVFDPFCGSGTTAVMAGYHGRNAVSADLRQSQIDIASRRIARRLAEGRAVAPEGAL